MMQGLILVDKPEGITSFGAVAAVRRLAGTRRAGHTGTLDPMATGVLPVLIGRATRLSSLLIEKEKRYTATLRLGITTDTKDRTGRILSETDHSVTPSEFERALHSFRGEISQLPPMYSAVKKEGVRLYQLAREGRTVEREPRLVTIYELSVLEHPDRDTYVLDVLCSKGTYIRSLCDDIGAALGCGAVLTALRRTVTAGFSIENCVPLSKLQEKDLTDVLQPADRAVFQYAPVSVTPAQGKRFLNGGALSFDRLILPELTDRQLLRVYDGPEFLGMGQADFSEKALKVKCIVKEARNP